MKKFEVLSPAGDLESLKVALKAGADAVYFGLNKFNARMKADNISLDNLLKDSEKSSSKRATIRFFALSAFR